MKIVAVLMIATALLSLFAAYREYRQGRGAKVIQFLAAGVGQMFTAGVFFWF